MPASYHLWGKSESFSVTEQRKLAAWPTFSENKNNLSNITSAIDSFFNDHLFLRKELITLHNLLKYFVFKQSPSNRVWIGDNNWLFYSGELRYSRPLDSAEIAAINTSLSSKRKWLAERGVDYLFLGIPDKAAVYSEFLPKKVKTEIIKHD